MNELELKKMVRDIDYLATMYNKTLIQNVISTLHPADLAEIFHHLPEHNRERIFHLLDPETASDVLAMLNDFARDDILEDLSPQKIAELAKDMESDDLTDMVSQLPREVAGQVLAEMNEEDSQEVKELLQHPEKTAGAIMAKEFVSVKESVSVDEAIAEVRSKAEEVRDVFYVFVVDAKNILVGVLSLKRLILAPSKTKISEIMNRKVIAVHVDRDQEEVAHLAKKYDLVSIPVISKNDELVGRITFDDVMDVIDEEVSEDINKMAGIGGEKKIGEPSAFKISKVRLPWLLIGLIGGAFAAMIISSFEESLKNIIALSFFTPVIMSMGGNIGIQSSTVMVRGMATGEISFFGAYKHLFKELKVALLNGFVCSLLFFIAATLWKEVNLGILLGGSLFLVMNMASIIGAIVPLLLKRFNIDPAIATGPFITITNDIIGLIIYFSMATLILSV